ncbi:recombinase family protein [Pelagibacterium flavum]|uniref:Recombinase family protein n=1 Tax=Pelagibacterium flavum TaxID=2984530 RepID=A0ABY6IKM3_9HYPH|nr:recombinase family protein [Pelagibacterium sp. YIM 151497]UYQ71146.1 recombinase family protein [Pelagibacterium sp. YIM 151497]UYQ71358.1 recombinase family protein [Pelagibacterium sp. YIM 151497]UYQ72594.1 recombinase family protein [Pelagibacterium sp. YIM 151497]
MNGIDLIPTQLLKRKAVVYVRQSSQSQVMTNLESQRRQYDLVDIAREHGFMDVEVIDDDLGRSASGTVARPGFDRLVAWLCAGNVGAVLCQDASRLARNGRDWHHLLELCGLVEARVIDHDGVYNPCQPNDRLLLGMKGSISEFELGVLRTRMHDAVRSKARRGELRLSVPFGYIWHREAGLGLDPDLRLQEVIRLIFTRFGELGSARQVLLSMTADQIHFPRPSDEGRMTSFTWLPIRYRNVISVLKNPFYAGVYVYGKSEKRTSIVDGRARRSYGHSKPVGTWEVFIKDHHEGYISWDEYERNQQQLALNNYGRAGGVKSGRGGRALLSGMMTCARCGRRLSVTYTGNPQSRPVYRCDKPNLMMGLPRCMTFGGPRVDAAVARELLRAVEPLAIEAAFEAERMHRERQDNQRQIRDLELQQARYEANLAERRYAACDPDNRLIAAQLEKNWEVALRRVRDLEVRQPPGSPSTIEVDPSAFANLAENLSAAWDAPDVTMRARQQLLRTLIADIIVDVDDAVRDVVLTIHWRGGQHSELRVHKPQAGEHGCATAEDALAVMRSMAGRWSDEHIAASLNRMGLPTGHGKTWTAHRVSSVRRVRGIHAYRSAEKNGEWLTMTEAAKALGVTRHAIRRLIKTGTLPAVQVVRGAPYQIRAEDLASETIKTAIARKGRPCRTVDANTLPMFTDT